MRKKLTFLFSSALQGVRWSDVGSCSGADDAVQVTWVGHATLLVQMEGFTFLTDPVFSQRCSPVQWAGPRCVSRAPHGLTCTFEDGLVQIQV